ncbi:MAG: DUF4293 domain-containing protein [Bacteroidetes bacterium]|nr:DUF4293 domain-containing protein [Bacteroidota bacterium]
MIQRIQSLYLLVSATLVTVATFFNFAIFSFNKFEIIFSPYAITASVPEVFETQTMLSLSVSMWLMAAFSIGAIFAYKNRKLQMNIIRYVCLFKVALIVFVAFFVHRLATGFPIDLIYMQLNASTLLFVISIITDILAFFAIRKDEKLVRSIDRIR